MYLDNQRRIIMDLELVGILMKIKQIIDAYNLVVKKKKMLKYI